MYERQNSSGMDFAKEDGVWYAQVKGWPGPKAMCAMVDGADTFLDHLSGNGDRVRVVLSRSPQAGYAPLTYLAPHPAGDGAYYTVDLNGAEHRMWLCGVTEFVFGAMPDRIYYRTAGSASPKVPLKSGGKNERQNRRVEIYIITQ